MKFAPTELPDVVLVEVERLDDPRGFFGRTWCEVEFATHGLEATVAQCNLSHNRLAATLRGMHMQREPGGEAKLVTCMRGAIFDVAVDMRADSPTYLRWVGVTLRERDYRSLYIPRGFAHGFQTLQDDTLVHYQMSTPYRPECSVGFRFDDPAFGIQWPLPTSIVSERDQAYTLLATPLPS